MNIRLFQSREIVDYKLLFEGLAAEFSAAFPHSLLEWCGVMPRTVQEKDRTWEVWLIEKNREIVGLCGLYAQLPGYTDELWLGWFGILPSYRSKGVGAVVLQQMESLAVERGCGALYSYVPESGRPLRFYLRCGFTRLCTVAEYLHAHPQMDASLFESGNDHVIMKKIA
jgi:GNAT superfamily N-acetyltransferase